MWDWNYAWAVADVAGWDFVKPGALGAVGLVVGAASILSAVRGWVRTLTVDPSRREVSLERRRLIVARARRTWPFATVSAVDLRTVPDAEMGTEYGVNLTMTDGTRAEAGNYRGQSEAEQKVGEIRALLGH